MAATTTRSSSSCMGFFRAGTHPPRPRARANSTQSSRKTDGVAMWLINGVATAFFASLEHCCIRIQTHEDIELDEENDMPLIFNDGNLTADDHLSKSSRATRRVRNKSKNMSHEALFVDH
ncbi:hypothetical protein QQ045_012956 [Rhodiola kirilowii]